MKNFYFVILADARNSSDAIQEAHRLAKEMQCKSPVEVHQCGTQEHLFNVFKDGEVAGMRKKG